jgi:hypothetical protein
MLQDTPARKGASLFGMPMEKGRWGLVASGLIINLCMGPDTLRAEIKKSIWRLYFTHILL